MQPSILVRSCLGALALAAPAGAQEPAGAPPAKPKVDIERLDGKVRVTVDGQLFTEYVYRGWANPILYPVHGAAGVPITRNFPMRKGVEDERPDHEHHRSLWFAHGEINGHDFWAGKGRIVQDTLSVHLGEDSASLTATNRYVVGDEVICRDERVITFRAGSPHSPTARSIDYRVTITASEGDVVFGDTKEGTMAIRTIPELRLRGKVAAGKARNSEGVTGRKMWGKRAAWVDYWGPVGGKVIGVAIFDHPDNHGYPCRWHARDYGLVAANPWGIHHFEGAPKRAGEMRLKKGGALTLRYRFYFHEGDTRQARVADAFASWARPGAAGEPKDAAPRREPRRDPRRQAGR